MVLSADQEPGMNTNQSYENTEDAVFQSAMNLLDTVLNAENSNNQSGTIIRHIQETPIASKSWELMDQTNRNKECQSHFSAQQQDVFTSKRISIQRFRRQHENAFKYSSSIHKQNKKGNSFKSILQKLNQEVFNGQQYFALSQMNH